MSATTPLSSCRANLVPAFFPSSTVLPNGFRLVSAITLVAPLTNHNPSGPFWKCWCRAGISNPQTIGGCRRAGILGPLEVQWGPWGRGDWEVWPVFSSFFLTRSYPPCYIIHGGRNGHNRFADLEACVQLFYYWNHQDTESCYTCQLFRVYQKNKKNDISLLDGISQPLQLTVLCNIVAILNVQKCLRFCVALRAEARLAMYIIKSCLLNKS